MTIVIVAHSNKFTKKHSLNYRLCGNSMVYEFYLNTAVKIKIIIIPNIHCLAILNSGLLCKSLSLHFILSKSIGEIGKERKPHAYKIPWLTIDKGIFTNMFIDRNVNIFNVNEEMGALN